MVIETAEKIIPERELNERALQLAQLEQIQLENEKLRLELAKLKKGTTGYSKFSQWIPFITTFLAITGFLWGVVQYIDQQGKNRRAQESQSLRQAELTEREFMKPWLDSQRDTYDQALSAAATVANSDDSERLKHAKEDFWELYQAKMILVETKSVSGAMVRYGYCLNGVDSCSKEELNTRLRALATAMAESMAATAKMTYKEFADNQFRYTSGP